MTNTTLPPTVRTRKFRDTITGLGTLLLGIDQPVHPLQKFLRDHTKGDLLLDDLTYDLNAAKGMIDGAEIESNCILFNKYLENDQLKQCLEQAGITYSDITTSPITIQYNIHDVLTNYDLSDSNEPKRASVVAQLQRDVAERAAEHERTLNDVEIWCMEKVYLTEKLKLHGITLPQKKNDGTDFKFNDDITDAKTVRILVTKAQEEQQKQAARLEYARNQIVADRQTIDTKKYSIDLVISTIKTEYDAKDYHATIASSKFAIALESTNIHPHFYAARAHEELANQAVKAKNNPQANKFYEIALAEFKQAGLGSSAKQGLERVAQKLAPQ